MTLVLGHTTNNPTEAVVLMNELVAGGFNPVIFDYHHGHIAIGNIMALGGFRVMLPEQEIQAARDFVQARREITNFDPIPQRYFIDIFRATILSINPLFPMCLLPPIALLILWIGLISLAAFFTNYSVWVGILENSYLLCIISILMHAKYVALPRMRNAHES